MVNIIVKVDDYTGEVIRDGDLVEVSAVINGQGLKWDFSKESYELFREQLEPFMECAQALEDYPDMDLRAQTEQNRMEQRSISEEPSQIQGSFEFGEQAQLQPSIPAPRSNSPQVAPVAGMPKLPENWTNSFKSPRPASKSNAPGAKLLTKDKVKKVNDAKGKQVLLLRGASLSNFRKQQVRASELGIALVQRRVRVAKRYDGGGNYRVCDIYGWKIMSQTISD